MTTIIDLKNDTNHEPMYLFKDEGYMYFVEDGNYDDFLDCETRFDRIGQASVVIKLDNSEVVKRRF